MRLVFCFRYGGVGGLSEKLGWTAIQREEKPDGELLGGLTGGSWVHFVCTLVWPAAEVVPDASFTN